jgi:predicted metal-binding membrane protein
MALLFVTGVMNLLWVGLITVFVLVEKMTPTVWLSRGTGLVLAGLGVVVMVRG